MLRLDVKPGDTVDIDNGRIVVTVEAKSGQKTRLGFDADPSIKIRMVERQKSPAQPGFRRLTPVT